MGTMTEHRQATAGADVHSATEPPFGAVIVVYRRIEAPEAPRFEYLVLHRAGEDPTFEGEWAWTPPSGCRFPDERVKDCARRELEEETGLPLPTIPTAFGNDGWEVFLAQAPPTWQVRLSEEHDRFE